MTSRIEGDKDQDLLGAMGGRGFPTLAWIDAEGNKIAEQGDRSVDSFRATGQALTKLQQLADKSDRTPAENVDYFLARIELGQLEFEAAKVEADKLPADDRIAAALLDLEIADAKKGIKSQEGAIAVGKKFAEDIVAKGRAPKSKGIPTAEFWMIVREHAKDSKDKELFKKCIEGVKSALGDDKRYERVFKQLEGELEKMDQ